MEPRRLPNGNILAPYRIKDPKTGTVGDGMLEIDRDHPDYDDWERELPVKLDERS